MQHTLESSTDYLIFLLLLLKSKGDCQWWNALFVFVNAHSRCRSPLFTFHISHFGGRTHKTISIDFPDTPPNLIKVTTPLFFFICKIDQEYIEYKGCCPRLMDGHCVEKVYVLLLLSQTMFPGRLMYFLAASYISIYFTVCLFMFARER